MNYKDIKVEADNFPEGCTSLIEYCYYLKNKNSVVLHLIENYVGYPLDTDDRLLEIRKIILDVGGNINRLPYNIFVEEDEDEGL